MAASSFYSTSSLSPVLPHLKITSVPCEIARGVTSHDPFIGREYLSRECFTILKFNTYNQDMDVL